MHLLLPLAKVTVLVKWLAVGLAQNIAIELSGLSDRIVGWLYGLS